MMAAGRGHIDLIELLLMAGATLNDKSKLVSAFFSPFIIVVICLFYVSILHLLTMFLQ